MTEWQKYQELVLYRLSETQEGVDELRSQVALLHVQIAKLKTELTFRSGVWGLVAGAIPATVAVILVLLS